MAWAVAGAILTVGLLTLYSRRLAIFASGFVVAVGIVLLIATVLLGPTIDHTNEAVSADARIDPVACPDTSRPIAIIFKNEGQKTVTKVAYSLIGRAHGHSTIAYRAFLRDDKIIEGGGGSHSCHELSPLNFAPPRPENIHPERYDWSIDVSLVDFAA